MAWTDKTQIELTGSETINAPGYVSISNNSLILNRLHNGFKSYRIGISVLQVPNEFNSGLGNLPITIDVYIDDNLYKSYDIYTDNTQSNKINYYVYNENAPINTNATNKITFFLRANNNMHFYLNKLIIIGFDGYNQTSEYGTIATLDGINNINSPQYTSGIDYTVNITKVSQSKYFDNSYYFNFNYDVNPGTINTFIPHKGDKTEVYLLEENAYTYNDNYVYSNATLINTFYTSSDGTYNQARSYVSSNIIYNHILSNTPYKLFIRTYYGGTNPYINSNIYPFTSSNYQFSNISIYSGYYNLDNSYFDIAGDVPNQTINNLPNNIINYTNNIISPTDNNKRSITLNGSYFYYVGNNILISNDWFAKTPNDMPIEFGFYYLSSNTPLIQSLIIKYGNHITIHPTDTSNILYPNDPTDLRAVVFNSVIDRLEPEKTYYYVSYMKNGNGSYYAEVERFTTLPINILSYQAPNLKPGEKWYQLYDNWELASSPLTNTINPFYRLKSSISDDRNYPIFYYHNANYTDKKNYQFRTIVENFYDFTNPNYDIHSHFLNDKPFIGSSFTNFMIKTPWGENNLQPVPYFKKTPINNLINLYLYSNINSIDIPNKPIDSISSTNGSNAQNPITYISNPVFTTVEQNTFLNVLNFKSQGLIYTDVNDTDWTLQGYAFFNFFNPSKIDPNQPYNVATGSNVNNMVFDGDDEIVFYMDDTNTPIGCKGWHLIEKKNQLIWFDKYIPTTIDSTENTRNLPVGGNPDDYYSNKTSEEKWRQNNYVAKYIPYQSFNISFSYSNNSNTTVDMYVGSKLPKYENGVINYFDDYTKITTLDNTSPNNCEFVGLQGNQYVYFVANAIEFDPSQTLATYSVITLGDFKFAGSYNSGNNILYSITESNNTLTTTSGIENATYSIKLGYYNNVDVDYQSKYSEPITLKSNAGNGVFNSGIWENGVWNNGWREDKTKQDFFKIDQFFSYNLDKKWQLQISGPVSSVSNFNIGDKVSISNIVAVDINEERKLLKNYYTIIEATYSVTSNYISVEFETDFPLRRVEVDSDEHRICVTKNVWLSGVFLNGYFKGIWNNGLFSGYPLITKMDESHWIDGVFNGGHFTAKKYSVSFDNIGNSLYSADNTRRLGLTFSTLHKLNENDSIIIYDNSNNLVGETIVLSVIDEMNLITGISWDTVSNLKYNLTNGNIYTTISTGLAQNLDFYSNNVSNVSSLVSLQSERVFSYNSWMDVNYSNQSAVNIGKPYYYLDKISNRSYSENNLYGYPTNDILSSNSTFRDSFSKSSRVYKLGKKWKIFNDFVGDSSTFEEYFDTTTSPLGLSSFNNQGWDIKLNNKYDVNIQPNTFISNLGSTMSYISLYFNNQDYSNSINEGDFINLNYWSNVNNNSDDTAIQNSVGLTVSYILTHITGITASPMFGYATQSLPDTNYTMIGFDNFSYNSNDTNTIETLATMSYFGLANGVIGVTNSVGPAYNTQNINTFTIDISKSKYIWSIDISLNNSLVFSRTPEPLDSTTTTIGKELKVDSNGDGGVLNLITATSVNNRTNGTDTNTLDKSNYTLIEFDILQNNSPTSSYIDPNLGNIPPLHFNNLNFTTKNFSNSGITYSQTIPTRYLPINSNVNHLTTNGTKKQEFFYNKRNLLMNLKGNGLLGKDTTSIYLDNIKMYQVDMIPFFQYFKYSNINTSVQIPSNGTSPSIDYANDDTTNNIGITSDTNNIITYFSDNLITTDITVPEGINWVVDYGLTASSI
jgi:hypothetical protein